MSGSWPGLSTTSTVSLQGVNLPEKPGEDDIGLSCRSVAQDSGLAGADLARKWLEKDNAKNAMELAGYRQQLRRQGMDTGKDRGMSLGM